MMYTPMEYADSLRIGSVDFVSPNELKVTLDIESPSNMALNTGVPRPFPRINSYVLLPGENGFLVAQTEWITIEHSSFPKRKGMQDFGVIDLPFPVRKMSLNPLGILKLKTTTSSKDDEPDYEFSRGVETFPTVGDPVILPSQKQLRSIVESGENRRVQIGTSPLAANARVAVDPDRLFGRHLAVLGNTGSGKSCSVSGLIRWSMEAAKRAISKENANARFIVLDPNGEYSQAFKGLSGVNVFSVGATESIPSEHQPYTIYPLRIPIWFWNSAEWCAFAQASAKTQRPVLLQALRSVRDGKLEAALTPSTDMRRYLQTLLLHLSMEINNGSPWAGGGKAKGFKESLDTWEKGLEGRNSFSDSELDAITALKQAIAKFKDENQSTGPSRDEWPKYTKPSTDILFQAFRASHVAFGGSDKDTLPIDADAPRPFTGEALLRSIQANAELMKASDYVETMLMRVRTLLSDARLNDITDCETSFSLDQWLNQYIYNGVSNEPYINIIDLSLVPSEVVHIITAVIARMVFEALQRYRKLNNGKRFQPHWLWRKRIPLLNDIKATLRTLQHLLCVRRSLKK